VWRIPDEVSLGAHEAHVWRIRLRRIDPRELMPLLSADEQARAGRFVHERVAQAYTVSHGMLRRILARYGEDAPEALRFEVGQFGKPALVASAGASALEFNLSHSGDLALIAVSRGGPVGVDVEARNREIRHIALAERFFSPVERAALRALAHDGKATTEGFFNAWTRKEAYLKATGHGITRGLHHFDVTLTPRQPAALLADRLDPSAPERWRMSAIDAGEDYAGAVVVPRAVTEVALYDLD
jgi:4'-phosphopantetheinyl transferase